MAQWLERKTLIHVFVGLSPASGISAPQRRGFNDSASGIGQESRFQLKSDLHLGKFERDDYCMGALYLQLGIEPEFSPIIIYSQ